MLRLFSVGVQVVVLVGSGWFAELPPRALSGEYEYAPLPVLELLLAPFPAGYRPAAAEVAVVSWMTLAAGITSWMGLWTRSSLALFATGSLALQAFAYSFGAFHHAEGLLIVALGILAAGPSGAALSIDKLRTGETTAPTVEASAAAGAALRLVRWCTALAYASAGVSKLFHSGLEWANGYTLQFYAFVKGADRDRPLGLWLSTQHELAQGLSWAVLAFELGFGLLLWRPRLWVLFVPAGLAFHLGTELCLGAAFPQFAALLAAFVPWSALVGARRSRPHGAGRGGGSAPA